MLNRRDTTKLIVAGAAATALPGAAKAASREDWVRDVQRALREATKPGGATKLTLTRFGFGKKRRRVAMSAVVRMDWAPGHRIRRFEVRGKGETLVFNELMAEITAEFRKSNPDGVT